jgi:hypothetical protein
MESMRAIWVGTAILALAAVSSAANAQATAELWVHESVVKLPHDHQGPFVKRDDGAIVAIDSKDSLVSHDLGKTWQNQPLFAPQQQTERPITVSNERALLRTESGTIVASFMNLRQRNWTWKNQLHDAPDAVLPAYAMRSLDGGRTWQDLHKLHDDWTGAIRDIIQTKEGRIVIAAQKMLHNPGRHATITYWSDDDGKTWQAGNTIDLGGQGHHGGNMEPTLVELADGRVWMLIRTNWGEFWSAWSYDGGRTWRVLEPSGIKASSAPAIVERLASGKLAMVWNQPYPEGKDSFKLSGGDGLWSETPVSNHREELSIAFSSDEGQSWTKPIVLARQAGKWLSYPYLFEPQPGILWLTTMQGGLRLQLREDDFAK